MLKLLLKHLSNYLRTLVIPLINCKVSLSLNGPKNFRTILEQLKAGFKRAIK